MNIYEKIQLPIKMTGDNKFAGYKYCELDDFIKPLNELMEQTKMTAYASFTSETATLTAVNIEKPEEQIVITSPFGTASLKGCHEVQNIGAVETYQRRYLYQALFDIAESDGLNATQGKPEEKPKTAPKTPEKAKDEKPFDVPDNPPKLTLEEALETEIKTKDGIKKIKDLDDEKLRILSECSVGAWAEAAKIVMLESKARKQ